MSVRVTLLRLWFPSLLRSWMLGELARVTAEGFAVDVPSWCERSFETRLAAYARFTAQEARALLAQRDEEAIAAAKERLRRGAAGMGATARRFLGLRRPEDAFEAWKLLYRQIGIDLVGRPAAHSATEITVTRCFFSEHYTGPVCGLIGSLDDGMADGLFGGATLMFSERLSEGGPCCRAVLRLEEMQG